MDGSGLHALREVGEVTWLTAPSPRGQWGRPSQKAAVRCRGTLTPDLSENHRQKGGVWGGLGGALLGPPHKSSRGHISNGEERGVRCSYPGKCFIKWICERLRPEEICHQGESLNVTGTSVVYTGKRRQGNMHTSPCVKWNTPYFDSNKIILGLEIVEISRKQNSTTCIIDLVIFQHSTFDWTRNGEVVVHAVRNQRGTSVSSWRPPSVWALTQRELDGEQPGLTGLQK